MNGTPSYNVEASSEWESTKEGRFRCGRLGRIRWEKYGYRKVYFRLLPISDPVSLYSSLGFSNRRRHFLLFGGELPVFADEDRCMTVGST